MPKRKQKAARREEEESEEEYLVEDILEFRVFDGREQFLIQWVGYADPSWEGKENILNPKKEFRRKMDECRARYVNESRVGGRESDPPPPTEFSPVAGSFSDNPRQAFGRSVSSREERSRGVQEEERDTLEDIRVKTATVVSMRKENFGISALISFADGTPNIWVPLDTFRVHQPQALIDFFVARTRFSDSDERR